MRARAFALALVLALPPALALSPGTQSLAPRSAEAAVSILMTLDELVAASSFVVVGTAQDRYSQWEELGGGRRIVTYTRVKLERSVIGEAPGEVWVRTLGGVVGKLGQSVSGEAQIPIGSRSLLFLMKAEGAVVVTGMAQGHFPIIEEDSGQPKLAPSPDAGALLPRRGPSVSAREVLVGAALDTAALAIQHARRTQNDKK